MAVLEPVVCVELDGNLDEKFKKKYRVTAEG
jgi:hypothetical protein